MPRGGYRRNAGRPRKESAERKPVMFKRYDSRRRNDDDEDQPVRSYVPLQKLVQDIRRRASGSVVAAVRSSSADWVQGTVDYALTHSLYDDWPLVKSAVDWAIDTALENGYRVESDNEEAKKLCDRLGEVLRVDTTILPRWIWGIHVDGNVFEEVRWGSVDVEGKSYSAPIQLFPIPASEVRYKWKDKSGQEIEWGQADSTGQVKALKLETLLVEAWRPDGYNPFGTPMISSVLDDVETLLTFQTDYRDIVKWYLKPLWHVKVGTPDKPASDTLLDSIKSNWEDREPNTDLITAGNIEIMEHGIGERMPPVTEFFNYHDAKQSDGLQSPFTHVLRMSSQASAAEIRDNSLSRVVFIQRWLKRKLEQIFAEVLEKNNIEATVRVVFQPLRALTLKDKAEIYLRLLNPQQVTLSDESRLEVEQKIRMEILGVPRDDSLVQQKEPMPGQQGLVNRVRGIFSRNGNKKDGDVDGEKMDSTGNQKTRQPNGES